MVLPCLFRVFIFDFKPMRIESGYQLKDDDFVRLVLPKDGSRKMSTFWVGALDRPKNRVTSCVVNGRNNTACYTF
jgi:hypothetical protein